MDTLGLVELASIAAGSELADGMVKSADVELLKAAPICGGRFLVQVAGDREAVETSVRFAQNSGRKLLDCFVVSNVAAQVIEALKKPQPAQPGDALAVVEAKNVSSGIEAADRAVKRSRVTLVRLVPGTAIMGKSYFVLSGDVAAVREAALAARAALGDKLIESVVIPRPDAAVFKALTGTR